MIISHKHRFIFIKTMKTAGTSIEVFLSDHCGPRDVLTPIHPSEPGHLPRNHRGVFDPRPALRLAGRAGMPSRRRTLGHVLRRVRFYNHMPALLVRSRVPRDVWEGYFKFCVEREPFSKTVSLYRMNRAAGGARTLDEFLAQPRLLSDWHRYADDGGRPIVDRILRYEALDAELAEVFARLGIPFPGKLQPKAKAAPSAPGAAAEDAETFSPAQRRKIRARFANEFAQLYPSSP